jgi:hypothetical protein
MSARRLPLLAVPADAAEPPRGLQRPPLAEPYPLSRAARRVLAALVRALCPARPFSPEIAARVEAASLRMMRYMHPAAARGLAIALRLLEWAPLLLLQSLRRLSRLDRDAASRAIERLARSRLALVRTLIVGVRGLVLSAYFDQDEVHRAIGYAPLPFLSERIALRRRLLAEANPPPAEALA